MAPQQPVCEALYCNVTGGTGVGYALKDDIAVWLKSKVIED